MKLGIVPILAALLIIVACENSLSTSRSKASAHEVCPTDTLIDEAIIVGSTGAVTVGKLATLKN